MTKVIITESQLKRTINELFSQKLALQLVAKFREEDNTIPPETLDFYINRFQQIKDSPKIQNKDITTYSWEDLKQVIDLNQPEEPQSIEIPGSELKYDKNGIKVYFANTKQACVKYGTGYNFCISSRGEDNRYEDYRYDDQYTIYFIVDENKSKEMNVYRSDGMDSTFEDPSHLLVVMVDDIHEDHWAKEMTYSVHDANNDPETETIYYKWSDFEDEYPQFNQLQHILIPQGLDETEESFVNLKKYYHFEIHKENTRTTKILNFDPRTGMIPFDIKHLPQDYKIIQNYLNGKPTYLYSFPSYDEIPDRTYPTKVDKTEYLKWLIDVLDYDVTLEDSDEVVVTENLPKDPNYLKYIQVIWKIYMEYLHYKNKLNIQN